MNSAICYIVLIASAFVMQANALPKLDPCIEACLDVLAGCKAQVCARVAETSTGVEVKACPGLFLDVGASLCATLCLGGLPIVGPLLGGLPIGRK